MTFVAEPLLFDLPAPRIDAAPTIDLNVPHDGPWPDYVFAHLPMFGYDLIMADPPSPSASGALCSRRPLTLFLHTSGSVRLVRLFGRFAVQGFVGG